MTTVTRAASRNLLKNPRHDRFRSIDLVENQGLDLTGGFHSTIGVISDLFQVSGSSTGKIKRLDIGQAK